MPNRPRKKRALPLSRAYQLLEPGPVLLLTTTNQGRDNVMTLSWHTMMEFTPPLVGCVVSGRDYSFKALVETRECVLNIPTARLARAVVGCGNTSGRKVDKFVQFGLTRQASRLVAPPRLAQCHASLECRVVDLGWVERYNFFVLEVLGAWIDSPAKAPATLHHAGHGRFRVAGRTVRLPSRMK